MSRRAFFLPAALLAVLFLSGLFDFRFQTSFALVLNLDGLGFHHRVTELLEIVALANYAVAHYYYMDTQACYLALA